MKRLIRILVIITLIIGLSYQPLYAYSIRHHIINMGKSLVKLTFAPLYGVFIKGPRNIKEAWDYEVHDREKCEKRGLLRYKLFAIWRAPGEEAKGIIDGLVETTQASGQFLKEFLSIIFSD